MHLPIGSFSPEVRLGLVSASRNCFPRELSERRTRELIDKCRALGVEPLVPEGECAVIETRDHALQAAAGLEAAGCDAAVLFLGNFSPEIEDAVFVKRFPGPVMVMAAAEESAATLAADRGDALCGLLSAALALSRRRLMGRVHIPPRPVLDPVAGAREIQHFVTVVQVLKGVTNAVIGLFGPRPRDFETCNYNADSVAGLGVEVEEWSLLDLINEVERVAAEEDVTALAAEIEAGIAGVPGREFSRRLALYEKAVLNLRDRLRLSGMATQCWTEQELKLGHVPCAVNARMAAAGFPIACENDAYSLIAELMAQYASDAPVTVLDLNHSIPRDLGPELGSLSPEDLVGLFHCGNTAPCRMRNPEMKHQIIMKRGLEPDGEPEITRGTIEGAIAASELTLVQLQAAGSGLRAYIAEGSFLDMDPGTFGAAGAAHVPGFGRFYRHALLGRFHHHSGVAFDRCGRVLFDALRLLGVEEVHTPLPSGVPYPGENPF